MKFSTSINFTTNGGDKHVTIDVINYQGNWSTGGDDKNKWIDFVIYSGSEKKINFGEIQETVLGFLFSLKAGTIPEAPVEVLKSGENLNLKWNSLSVNALIKPYEERATLVLK